MTASRFEPSGPLNGELRPPPDKSISHRAGLIAAMGEGETRISNHLDSADTRSTLAAIRALGADVQRVARAIGAEIAVRGVGLRGVRGSAEDDGPLEIDVGNAGTLLRILPGWLAGQDKGLWRLYGDDSISRRPVDRIVVPLSLMGADLTAREDHRLPPLTIRAEPLHGIAYTLPVASAQVKSCLLVAGLLAEGETTVIEPQPTRDHTELILTAAGADIEIGEIDGLRAVTVRRAETLEPGEIAIPGDFSSAAFFIVAATLVAGSELRIVGVGLNPTRTGLLSVLSRMGADVEAVEPSDEGGEPVGALIVRHSELNGTEVGGAEVPLAIDELPLVALAACFAEGETVIRDAEELRRKESDRVATVVEGLRRLGAEIEATDDGMVITGAGSLPGGAIDAAGDHRLAMLGAVAGLASDDGVAVHGAEAAAISYPGFEADLAALRG